MTLELDAAGVALPAAQGRALKVLLRPASIAFRPGRVTAVLGPNGAGKSTLLSLLAGLRAPSSGRVRLDGHDLARFHGPVLALRRAVMTQDAAVAFEFTAQAVVELGRYPHRLAPSRDEAGIVRQALEAVDATALAQRIVPTLSGGEKARVHLARALAQVWEERPDGAARWLLLDEPTAALDLAHQHAVLALLRQWAHRRGVGVVVVLHDLGLALRHADEAVVLADATLHSAGPARELLLPPLVKRVWGVDCELCHMADGTPQLLFAPGAAQARATARRAA